MRARYYDPSVARFISEDPLGFGGGDVNLFAYVRNQPVNLADPLGLSSSPVPNNLLQPQRTFLQNLTLTLENALFFVAGEMILPLPIEQPIGGVLAREGIYEFKAASGKTYVGQSGDICARIEGHLSSGKLLPEDLPSLQTTEVWGGKTAREIAEQQRIDELGGIRSGLLENIRNPIGPMRQNLLP
jgi:hypothetical protein